MRKRVGALILALTLSLIILVPIAHSSADGTPPVSSSVAEGHDIRLRAFVGATFDPATTDWASPSIGSTSVGTSTLSHTTYLPLVETPLPQPNLFFDVNGSGLHEPGEPGLAGFVVCMEDSDFCTTTDSHGRFSLDAGEGERVSLGVTDPSASSSSTAMRYVNKWLGSKTIPAHEVNGVAVPEQQLNETEVFPITERIDIVNSSDMQIGLMHGFLTGPVPDGSISEQTKYVDVDYRLGFVRRWDGITSGRSLPDQHPGIDYHGALGTPILAAAPGTVIATGSDGGGARLGHAIGRQRFATDYGHTSSVCVEPWTQVERGQVIAYMGNAGTVLVHLHFELWPLPPSSQISNQTVIDFIFDPARWPWIPTPSGGEFPSGLDPYRDISGQPRPYADLVPQVSAGYWVVDNEPYFPELVDSDESDLALP
jgi:murein DD-endopeptidase MepM/ murein hydrolase activator NlpD